MTRRMTILAAVAAASLVAATPAVADQSSPATSNAGPTASYIVQFTPGSDRAAEVAKAKGLGMKVTFEYTNVFSGMAVVANQGQLRAFQANPNVRLIEADQVVTLDETQSGPTWGLNRTDQRGLPLDNAYTYPVTAGFGVTAYIIDTGILGSHTEFGTRVGSGYTAISDGGGTTDCNGHGTHVAGTVGGSTYGMAKKVSLVAVRVLGCTGSGTTSGVVAGMDWTVGNHVSGPAVANMSLGGGASQSTDDAVARMVADGISVSVAAGNSNADACNYSPARAADAITVGATTSTDARSSFSNFGSCLDIFAPGSGITSAWYTSTTATNSISGTSMASPHVAGAAALYLAGNPGADPATVASALTGNATTGKVTSPGTGSPNRLLFVDGGSNPPPPPPEPTPDVVPSAPTLLSVSNVTSTGASLAWSPPASGTLPFAGYMVRWGRAGPKGSVSWGGWVPASGMSHLIKELSPRTKYVWEVTASNNEGTGPAASSSFTTRR